MAFGGTRFGVLRDDLLDCLPRFEINDGFAVAFDDEVAEFEDADVDAVGEEGFVGVEGGVEARGFVNVLEGGASGAHFKSLFDAVFEFGVGVPTVGYVVGAVAALSDLYGRALEAHRRRARHTSVFLNEVAESAFGIGRGLSSFFFVGHIYEEFDDATVVAFGDLVVEGVDEDLVGADEGFVVDGVVEVAGEAGVVPEDERVGALVGDAVVVDHAVEVVASCGGAAAFGFVAKVVTEGEPVFVAECLNFGELLIGGLILASAATVATVGVYDGA